MCGVIVFGVCCVSVGWCWLRVVCGLHRWLMAVVLRVVYWLLYNVYVFVVCAVLRAVRCSSLVAC